jgi:hypothetical protein
MPTDILTLGGIVFEGYSPPSEMMGGGNQAMVVHKLPGGARVIDTLGPDDADIRWDGEFFGDTAAATALALDAMRAGGQVQPLVWGSQFRLVIVSNFVYRAKRWPVWVAYSITCTVYQNPAQGNLSAQAPSIDTLVGTDLGSAAEIGGMTPAEQLAAGVAPL